MKYSTRERESGRGKRRKMREKYKTKKNKRDSEYSGEKTGMLMSYAMKEQAAFLCVSVPQVVRMTIMMIIICSRELFFSRRVAEKLISSNFRERLFISR